MVVALLFPFLIVPNLVPAPFIRGCPVRRFWWHGQAENEVVYCACQTDRRRPRSFHRGRSGDFQAEAPRETAKGSPNQGRASQNELVN